MAAIRTNVMVRTSKRKLREVDFVFDGKEIRGLEQNPQTKSRWAVLARDGNKVMQFLSEGRYVANVVDGKVTLYIYIYSVRIEHQVKVTGDL